MIWTLETFDDLFRRLDTDLGGMLGRAGPIGLIAEGGRSRGWRSCGPTPSS